MQTWKKVLLTTLILGIQLPALAASVPVKLYRNPNCGCCNSYAAYLITHGFDVTLIDTNDMTSINRKFAVPAQLEGCHTAVIGAYVFEGLIPVEDIRRVLNEHRPIRGLSVPGMPPGAPGMPAMPNMAGNKRAPINVYYLESSPTPRIFASF